MRRRWRLAGTILAGLLFVCLIYCVAAPNEYEATARVELRTSPASALHIDSTEAVPSASFLSATMALETTADIFRSDRLAWNAITGLKLYKAPGFEGAFAKKFPDFAPEHPSPEARGWLIDRFHRRLHVREVPRTLLLEVRFRSRDAALSADVVNTLIRAYGEEETANRQQATSDASGWLNDQLSSIKARVDQDQQKLDAFKEQHGILSTPQASNSGRPGEDEHSSALLQIDEFGRQLVTATADRILAEAEFRAASGGDPELVVASDARLQKESSDFSVAVLQRIHARRSDLEQERAQLSAEHGPNFPRVVEIGRQLQDLNSQKKAEDARLLERFRSAWQTASAREQMVRQSLDQAAAAGMKLDKAAAAYERMKLEVDSSHDLYVRVTEKSQEAGLAAGVRNSNISVVDPAFPPARPTSPDPLLWFAITAFIGIWIAMGTVLLVEGGEKTGRGVLTAIAVLGLASVGMHAQAPTPSTSGLPTGVARIVSSQDTRVAPNPGEATQVWNSPAGSASGGGQAGMQAGMQSGVPMPAPIGPNDLLDITEYHTPEFHSTVRVSSTGTITLPMIEEVAVAGLDEKQVAREIEARLVARGMLLHPLVSVFVIAYSGQDVSVLGEVARPGVYPYTVHHRLLDLISAASGLSQSAGRLVNIFHREDPKTAHPVVLDPGGTDNGAEHNPELKPGDTVQVSRAGLVYVIGDVIRPGGFPVDPAQGLTVVQALSLAWGPSLNAASTRALLIREQNGGRTMTSLNLKRMLRGQEPDQLVHDRDILFVPDSTAHNLWNKSVETAIQSAIGVSIYGGLVYSQWLLPKSTTTTTIPPSRPRPIDGVGIEGPH